MRQIIILFEFQAININKEASFKEMIRKYPQFAFPTNNSCIIWTYNTVVEVRDNLMTGIGMGDKLFVSQVSAPAAWTTSIGTVVSEYVIKNLK